MQKIPLNLNSVRAVREIRAGLSYEAVRGELGISLPKMAKIESVCSNVPDHALAAIERLLNDRERLKRLISSLIDV